VTATAAAVEEVAGEVSGAGVDSRAEEEVAEMVVAVVRQEAAGKAVRMADVGAVDRMAVVRMVDVQGCSMSRSRSRCRGLSCSQLRW